MDCRCKEAAELYGTEAEAYAAEHLRSDGDALACPDTGARWQTSERDGALVLEQVDRDALSRRTG